MNIIENAQEIEALFNQFEGDGDGAYPTSRCLPGQWEQQSCQEWAERGEINGEAATIYWIFENDECDFSDGDNIPFDGEHIHKIELGE